ncbi:MAG: S8 family serine peptidase, partial [Chloroflexota bacterium]
VAATDKRDRLANFAGYGATTVDLGAPGVKIWSTVPGGDYRFDSGTSFANPQVVGTAALILSLNPNLSAEEVKALILDNVDVVPDLVGKTVTGGRLNIFKAVSATPLPLMASSVGTSTETAPLTTQQVAPLWTEALARWQAAGVDTSGLGNLQVHIADLSDAMLGLASGNTIWLDANAAGWGWFVDPTPHDDSEFTTPGDQGEQNRMDLLTVLEHEVGHILGFDHQETGVMEDTLATGTRKTPTGQWIVQDSALLDLVFAGEQNPLRRRFF